MAHSETASRIDASAEALCRCLRCGRMEARRSYCPACLRLIVRPPMRRPANLVLWNGEERQ